MLSRFTNMKTNKNLVDAYNPEQEAIKDALWVHFKRGRVSYSRFAILLGLTQQSLFTIFRGGRMTHKVEVRLRNWLDVHNGN